jgi:putative membrane protein
MNLSHTVKVVGSVVLSAVMAGSMMPVTVFAQNNDENPTEKTETVYSVLNSDGSISDTIVSSWLHDEDGINNIKETLNLTDVKNIKSNEKPSKDGNTYTWNAKGNDVYYEGTATKQLPVSVKIRYELDGQEMSAKDIEGKSGHLKLTISFTNNYSEVKNINGKSIVIHPSYLAGGMLNMSTGNFTNVRCESGKIVNDGTNEMLAFANIPGLNETLKSAGLDKVNNQLGISDDVTVEADVNNFDLGSIMVGMTNEIDLASELGEIGSVSELTDGIDQLMEADDQLIDGSKQLYDGTTQLKEQAAPLTGSSDQVRQLSSGAIQLNDGVKALQTGISQYTAGASEIISNAQQGLYGISQGSGQLSYVINNGIEEKPSLRAVMKSMSDGLKQMGDMAGKVDTKALQQAITDTNADLVKMEEYLNDTNSELETLKDTLTQASGAISGLNTLMQNGLQPAIDAANAKINSKNSEISKTQGEIDSYSASINSEITSIEGTIASLKEQANVLPEGSEKTEILNTVSTLEGQLATLKSKSQTQLTQVTPFSNDDFKELQNIIGNVDTVVTQMSGALTEASTSVAKLSGYLEKTQNTLNDMTKQLNETPVMDGKSIAEMMKAMQGGITQLKTGVDGANSYINTIDSSLLTMSNKSGQGANDVKTYSSKLSEGQTGLVDGSATLSEATGTLAGQSGTFNEMADGLDTLGKAFETLNDGAKQLYEGNEQFKSEGLDQLKEKVDLGVGELETLQSVMNEIKAMNKEYASYSGAPEGATVTSRYVFRTKEESSK